MAGKIPQSFIDQVVNQTDIVDLIDSYIDLKPKGKEYTACCPFHGEKTPSFTVNREKQFYHCFGCGAHGTAIGFLMEHEGLEFVETIEVLAQRLGLEVSYEKGSQKHDGLTEIYSVLETASHYYQQQLRHNQNAINYLKSRGISGEISQRFNIGFAPPGFDNLKNDLTVTSELLIKAGLLSEKPPNKTYDRFRHRIMFPIKDPRGRVIAFGGREIDGSMPKYINSPETELFHKGSTLYGLHEARQALGKIKELIIVEGYMDVVALAQHGVDNAIATLGTATTSQNIRNLLRYTSSLIFCFDGDRAGKDAAWKALQQILPEYKDGIDIRFAFMPQGEDPDSLIRSAGKDAFQTHLKQAMPLSEYFFTKLCAEIDISTLDGKAKLADAAQPLLNKLPKVVFRDLMFKELNKRVGTSITNSQPALQPSGSQTPRMPQGRNPKYTKTRLAIALLLREPQLAQYALPEDQLSKLSATPGVPLLIELLDIIQAETSLTSSALIERFHGRAEYPILQKLILWELPDMDNRELSFQKTMERFNEDIRRIGYDSFIKQDPT